MIGTSSKHLILPPIYCQNAKKCKSRLIVCGVGQKTHLEVWLNYRFLHDGVMKELLCAIGRRAGVHAVYWRYGVCFFDQRMQATFLLEAQPDIDPQQPGAGRLVWQAHVVQENKMAEVQRWLEDLLPHCRVQNTESAARGELATLAGTNANARPQGIG